MKISELIGSLGLILSEHGDIPVVYYCERAQDDLEVEFTQLVSTTYQGSDNEQHNGSVVRIEAT